MPIFFRKLLTLSLIRSKPASFKEVNRPEGNKRPLDEPRAKDD